MSYDLVKANLNLYAVLQNIEDLVVYDNEMASFIKDWNISIQFSVKNGPVSCLIFENGKCRLVRGKYKGAKIKLFFTSPEHCNKMFDNEANPIPLKGFTKIGFLTKDFPKLTERLEYYLKPTEDLLKEKEYLELNTRFTLNTAVYAVREIALFDPVGKLNASHVRDGVLLMKILPEGPAAHIKFSNGSIEAFKGDYNKPMSMMTFKNAKVANDLFNNKIDAFAAVAGSDVMLKGQISMLEAVNPILDRIQIYLS